MDVLSESLIDVSLDRVQNTEPLPPLSQAKTVCLRNGIEHPLSESLLSASEDVLRNVEPLPPLTQACTTAKVQCPKSTGLVLSQSLVGVSLEQLQDIAPLSLLTPANGEAEFHFQVRQFSESLLDISNSALENIHPLPPLTRVPPPEGNGPPGAPRFCSTPQKGNKPPTPGLDLTGPLSLTFSENSFDCDVSSNLSGAPHMLNTSGYEDVHAEFIPGEQNKPERISVKYGQKTDTSFVKNTFRKNRNCCARRCLSRCKITGHLILDCRRAYWQQGCSSRKQWLLGKLSQFHPKERTSYIYLSPSAKICQNAFICVYGLSQSTFFSVKREFTEGVRVAEKCDTVRGSNSNTMSAVFWLERYATSHGDRMPHKNQILLPVGTTKSEVYSEYQRDCVERGVATISKSHFDRVWRETLPNLKIKKQNDQFSKCTKCVIFTRTLRRTTDVLKRAVIKKHRKRHVDRQKQERVYYYRKRDLSRLRPDKYLSLIIDGMDQKKTFIPHFLGGKAKLVRGQDLMKTHITTVIEHGTHARHSFVDKGQFPHDSNLTISVLTDVLWRISKRGKKALPPVLFLQADNCWRENKNKYVLAFCEVLVSLKIFHEIHFAFLYVGHTHEDIDQYFSTLANILRQNEAETFPDLMNLIPGLADVRSIPDFRAWVSPLLNNIKGHTKPLQYKLLHNGASENISKVDLFYRGNSKEGWQTMGSLLSTKLTPRLIARRPDNVSADLESLDVHTLEGRVKNWAVLFDHCDDSSLQWWQCFTRELQSVGRTDRQLRSYSNRDSRWRLPHFTQCCREDEVVPAVENVLGPDLMNMIHAETAVPQVTVTQRRKQKQTVTRGGHRRR